LKSPGHDAGSQTFEEEEKEQEEEEEEEKVTGHLRFHRISSPSK
jgi:hypothetical protein